MSSDFTVGERWLQIAANALAVLQFIGTAVFAILGQTSLLAIGTSLGWCLALLCGLWVLRLRRRLRRMNIGYRTRIDELYKRSDLHIIHWKAELTIMNDAGDTKVVQTYVLRAAQQMAVHHMPIYFDPVKGSVTKAEFRRTLTINEGAIVPISDWDIINHNDHECDIFGFRVDFARPVLNKSRRVTVTYVLPRRFPPRLELRDEIHIALPTTKTTMRFCLPKGATIVSSRLVDTDVYGNKVPLGDGLRKSKYGQYEWSILNPEFSHYYNLSFQWHNDEVPDARAESGS